MNIENLWKCYKFPRCENCKKDCKGHLDYQNLCANLNYLKEYGKKNYEKNKESFEELKKILGNRIPNIFSFGCGLGLDYFAASEVFEKGYKYYGIDNSDWKIKETENYKNFEPHLPKTIKYDDGIFFLNIFSENIVLCFFNSLFTISNNSELLKDLVNVLQKKKNFYIVCDYTINNNFHMPNEENEFLKQLMKELKRYFNFKHFEILEGKGIIIAGER